MLAGIPVADNRNQWLYEAQLLVDPVLQSIAPDPGAWFNGIESGDPYS